MEELMNPETLAWIEKQKSDLVGWAEKFVEDTQLFKATDKTASKPLGERTPQVRTNQLRNMLNAAQSGSPLAVLINFLRYQIGREKRGWKHRPSGNKLLDLLTKDLKDLCDKGCETDDSIDHHELEAHLAAQLLGFIIREYTYQCRLAGTKL